ncbi:PRDX3 [Symbiodinium microadriaticum]|nr:PRDX3 [Symbiodinium microadriaticum]
MFKFTYLLFCILSTACAISLRPRFTAPTFKAKAVMNEQFIDVSLSQYIEQKQWTVLLFYPFDFTFVCPTELISFSEKADDFSAINTQVLAISTDSHHTHLAWSRTPRSDGGVGNLNIPLVADTSKDISRAYGVLVDDKDDDMYGAALRGLFLVDPSGRIRSVQINDDAVGRSVEETLRLLKAFQHADAHQGEACPASWVPGQDTIKTNPNGAKEYFRSHF